MDGDCHRAVDKISFELRAGEVLVVARADLGSGRLGAGHGPRVVQAIATATRFREQVLRNPQNPYTRQFLQAAPVPDPASSPAAGRTGWLLRLLDLKCG